MKFSDDIKSVKKEKIRNKGAFKDKVLLEKVISK
jgi:hypothetical protein